MNLLETISRLLEAESSVITVQTQTAIITRLAPMALAVQVPPSYSVIAR